MAEKFSLILSQDSVGGVLEERSRYVLEHKWKGGPVQLPSKSGMSNWVALHMSSSGWVRQGIMDAIPTG